MEKGGKKRNGDEESRSGWQAAGGRRFCYVFGDLSKRIARLNGNIITSEIP